MAAANADPPVELVIVDYGAQPPLEPVLAPLLAALAPENRVVLVTYRGRDHYHAGHARNLSIRASTGEVVIIASTEITPMPGYFGHVRDRLAAAQATWLSCDSRYVGVLVIDRLELLAAGGYDERIEFYGADDKDLRERLRRRGVPEGTYLGSDWLTMVRTSNADKIKHYRLPLSKTAMMQHGSEIFKRNRDDQVLVANLGCEWGCL
jgi:hypothetical protein